MLDFNSIKDQKIIIVGDVMLDAYLFGKVDRLSPEAPVPIVNFQREEYRLGGAANVALNIAALGAVPLLFGVTGNDDDGHKLKKELRSKAIDTSHLVAAEHRPTTVKTRIIGSNHQLLRMDKETTQSLDAKHSHELFTGVRSVIKDASALIFQDYDKGTLDEELISQIISLCKENNIPVIVDPKKRNFFSYREATLFKPNLKELKEGLKLDACESIPEIEEAARVLLERMHLHYVMVTLSERGVLICNATETWHFPAHIREIADVSGAGDTVVSVAALCLAQKMKASEIAILSNLAGGLVCEEIGAVPLNRERFVSEAQDLDLA